VLDTAAKSPSLFRDRLERIERIELSYLVMPIADLHLYPMTSTRIAPAPPSASACT